MNEIKQALKIQKADYKKNIEELFIAGKLRECYKDIGKQELFEKIFGEKK